MRRGGAGLIAAVLALAGCKGAAPKPADPKDPAASAVGREKGKGPAWLDESMAKLPGAGTGVPKAGSWAHPKDPNFNPARESRGLLAGKVLDPTGRGAGGVFIQIEPADAPSPPGRAQLGIEADASGYFMIKDLPPGRVYTLIAEAKVDGKPLVGVMQAKTPNPNLTISLRDDLAPPPGTAPPGPPTGPGRPSPAAPSDGFPPPPADLIPPMGLGPTPALPPGTPAGPAPARPSDGAWAPGTGAAGAPVPPTISPAPAGPPAGPTPAPPPADIRPTPTPRPENTAEGPTAPWRPPAASIPGPPVPPLPTTVPPLPPPGPAPSAPPAEKKSSRPGRPGASFALVDTLERPWDFATSRHGTLVLLDFITTDCVPCKRSIPVLVDLQARYGAAGLQLVGVVCDEVPQPDRAARAARYQQDHGLNYSLFVEPGPAPGPVRDRFGVDGYPTAVLLDGAGQVLWQGHPSKDHPTLDSAIRRHLGK